MAAATGARRGELCGLRWKHVDLDQRRLTIARSNRRGRREVIEKDTKTHQVRKVTLDVERWPCRRRTELSARSWRRSAMVTANSLLFSHEVDFSKPWRPDYVTLAFGRLRNEPGLDGVKLHHLRHFSATQLLSLGIDIRTVSGRLGHAKRLDDARLLRPVPPGGLRRAADVLGHLLGEQQQH